MRKRILTVVAIAVAVLVTAGTVAAQSSQRFSDVPLDHEAFEAIEWAADVQLTVGYGDGTFKPEQPLSRRHAVVFMERFYDDILGADGDEWFTTDKFTRANMMVLLKTINDGAPTTKPEPKTRWLPRPEGRTAEGRCAHRINDTDFYDWEDCASGSEDDPAMGRAEMQALAERVWTETSARGKPANPPALAEGRCLEARAAACYLPSTHTISIESGVTLRSLLHELAHALITGDAVMADCYADWTNVVPHCAHGALFRCAADALYVRYADIDAAGVCGDPPDLDDWARSTGDSRVGRYVEWRTEGHENSVSGLALALRCTNGTDLEVSVIGLEFAFISGTRGLIEYRFSSQSRPVRFEAKMPYDRRVLVMADGHLDRFLDDMAADTSGKLFLAMLSGLHESPEIDTEADVVLRVSGYRAHIQPHVEACTSG